MGCHKSNAQREVHRDNVLPQKNEEKSQIDNLPHHLNELEKEQTKPKVSRKKEIIKIREEINKIETKSNRKKSRKPRAGSLKG